MPKQDEAHEAGAAGDVGETASEPAFSMSARRQACEQYAPVEDCRSQARQKSGDQSISAVMVKGGIVVKLKSRVEAESTIAWSVGVSPRGVDREGFLRSSFFQSR